MDEIRSFILWTAYFKESKSQKIWHLLDDHDHRAWLFVVPSSRSPRPTRPVSAGRYSDGSDGHIGIFL